MVARLSEKYPELNDFDWFQDQVNQKSLLEIAEMFGTTNGPIRNAATRLGVIIPDQRPKRRPSSVPPKPIDYRIGERFGSLVVLSAALKGHGGATQVNVKCECGTEQVARLTNLVTGKKDNCGCLTAERQRRANECRRTNVGLCGYLNGCERDAKSKGLCGVHYREYLDDLHGPCHIEECEKPIRHAGHGLCDKHEYRYKKCGDPYYDYNEIDRFGYKVEEPKNRYRGKSVGNGKTMPEHRWVMQEWLGRSIEDHEEVHHMNGVRHDNDINNLELWSVSQPPGQRVRDKVIHAVKMLDLYGHMFPEIVLSREEYELRMAI